MRCADWGRARADHVFTLEGTQRFYDKQEAAHAPASLLLAREFDCLLQAGTSAEPAG
jgi:hypothetical protein